MYELTCLHLLKQGLFRHLGIAHVLGTAFDEVTSGGRCGASHQLAVPPDQTAAFECRHTVANDDRGVTLVSSTLLLIAVTANTHALNGDI